MDIKELLEYLDLEYPEEFEYFEHMADLLELEKEVSYDALYALFSHVPPNTLTELLANYFEEIMENLPDDSVDIYTLLSAIRQVLLSAARKVEAEDGRRQLCDEFQKFQSWYSLDSRVRCQRLSDGMASQVTVAEALALFRLEKLNEEEYSYDFSHCLDYELDEYSMSLSQLLPDYDEDALDRSHGRQLRHDCDCGCEKNGGDDAFEEGFIHRYNPVIEDGYEED